MQENLLNIINRVLENNDLSTIKKLSAKYNLQNDLNMDSIILAELTVRIEDEFEIDIFENGMIHTIGDIQKLLN